MAHHVIRRFVLSAGLFRNELFGSVKAQENPFDNLAGQLVDEDCPNLQPSSRASWQALTSGSLEVHSYVASNFGREHRAAALGYYLQWLLTLFDRDLRAAFECSALAAHHLKVVADSSLALDQPYRARVLVQLGHAFKFQALKDWSRSFQELRHQIGDTVTDAAVAAMPGAPPKRFMPRLHSEYQIALGGLHESLQLKNFDIKNPTGVASGAPMNFGQYGTVTKPSAYGRIEVHSICAYKPDPTSKTGAVTTLPELSVPNHRAFSAKHGYHYVVHTDLPLPEGVEAHYSKMVVVHDRFAGVDPPDWIFFIDCDAFFTNFDTSVEEILRAYDNIHAAQAAHFFVAEDPGGINTGVFIVRNSQWSIDFLKRVTASTFTVAWDQSMFFWEIVRGALEVDDQKMSADFAYPSEVRLVHQAHLNAFVPPASRDWMAHEWQPGDFVRHFAGCPWQENPCLRMMEETAVMGHLSVAAQQQQSLRHT
eukprot:TRINITY_DN50859_c0_g1_i1.p1 TRINITY_DN50859_c0_g1~~TRINITY_DN50859_c0_g1_i1.p1  ORF type:complete len:489 (-),score=48.01 TRINITY_DN50859_c0_g1_i1:42-1478(-)